MPLGRTRERAGGPPRGRIVPAMRRLLIASASILLAATAPAVAAPGDLDRSLGTGGRLFVEGILGGLERTAPGSRR